MHPSSNPTTNPIHLFFAFGTGGLLTLMVHFNGQLAFYGNALFSSWSAHGTGTAAAIIFLFLLRGKASGANRTRAPWWAYLGGLSGAVTVMLTSLSVNSELALSGTLALGLVGQVFFGLAADRWGLFGLPQRWTDPRDWAAIALILSGTAVIILFGRSVA